MPFSLKQKLSLKEQGNMNKEIDEIKKKHKNNKEKMDQELNSYYMKNSKGLLRLLTTLL